MRKILAAFLALGLVLSMTVVAMPALAVSQADVTVTPTTAGATAEYTVTFSTSAPLSPGDKVYIGFPVSTDLSAVSVELFKRVNATWTPVALATPAHYLIGSTLHIVTDEPIGAASLKAVISDVGNPPAGTYTLNVQTTWEHPPVASKQFTITTGPHVYPAVALFDLDAPHDVETTIYWVGATSIVSIKDDQATPYTLQLDTDYEVVSNTLRIFQDYLETVLVNEGDEVVLTIEFNTGVKVTFRIVTTDIISGASIYPVTAAFSLVAKHNVTTLITWGDANSVLSIVDSHTTTLTAGTHYTVTPIDADKATLTIMSTYLETVLTAVGQVVQLTVAFDAGAPATFTIVATDIISGASINPVTAAFSLITQHDVTTTITWANANWVLSIVDNHTTTLTAGTHYTITTIDALTSKLTIRATYLQTVLTEVGNIVQLTIAFDAGAPATFTIVASDIVYGASVHPVAATFNLIARLDVPTTITWNDADSVVSIKDDQTNTLTAGTHYTVTDIDALTSKLTIRATYLQTVVSGEGDVVELTVAFDIGPPATFAIVATEFALEAYSITLVPYSGVYNDLIEAAATVGEVGLYYICWGDPPSARPPLATIDATGATHFPAPFDREFNVPEAPRGNHKVYLTDDNFGKLAEANFEVGPTIIIDRDQGPVGTEVTMWGYGFSAGETGIQIVFRDQVLATVSANQMGSWQTTVIIPPAPGGSYAFSVRDQDFPTMAECCTMRFRVTPEIKVEPDEGPVGLPLVVTGTGFGSTEGGIQVTFDREVVARGISADVNGSWSTTIFVPVRPTGTYIIDAGGLSTRARDVPDVEFKIISGVAVQPSSAYVGDEITVYGGGFVPREENVRITFDGQVVATDITADSDGVWKSSFILPASTHGPHEVSAYGETTRAQDIRAATVNTLARIWLSPVTEVRGGYISISGDGFHGNSGLTVRFAGTPSPTSVRTLGNGDVSATVRVPASPLGSITVTATDDRGAEASASFTVQGKVLPAPQPISPKEGSRLRSGAVTFEWGRIETDSDVTYTLEVTGTGGSRRIADIDALSYRIPKEEALPKGDYSWQVKAVDEFGNESEWSSPVAFRVSPIPWWVWLVVGLVVLVVLMVVAYRKDKYRIAD